jgi:outer membrane lipoprotein-sorting protein
VELYVDATDYHVARSVVVDHDGNRNRLDFGKPATNLGLPAGMFEFTPPAGVPVITAEQ